MTPPAYHQLIHGGTLQFCEPSPKVDDFQGNQLRIDAVV